MTTTTLVVALLAIVVIGVISYLRFGNQEKKSSELLSVEKPQPEDGVILPCEGFISDVQILELSVEDLSKMSNRDLAKLVDYAGHKMVAYEKNAEVHDRWSKFFETASAALYGYV